MSRSQPPGARIEIPPGQMEQYLGAVQLLQLFATCRVDRWMSPSGYSVYRFVPNAPAASLPPPMPDREVA